MKNKNNETAEELIQKLFELNAYIGHRKNKTHPKAKKMYVYKNQNGISLIDLSKTVENLKKAEEFVFNLGKDNKTILFVGTKNTIAPVVEELCKRAETLYITHKWPPGILTNFETLRKNIELLRKMKQEKERGEWEKFPKHERIKLNKKLNKLLKIYAGVEKLETLPDALYLIDLRKERNAIKEALKLNITTIAIVDTNVDPTLVDYPIPANDDYPEVVKFITERIITSYLQGKKAKNEN